MTKLTKANRLTKGLFAVLLAVVFALAGFAVFGLFKTDAARADTCGICGEDLIYVASTSAPFRHRLYCNTCDENRGDWESCDIKCLPFDGKHQDACPVCSRIIMDTDELHVYSGDLGFNEDEYPGYHWEVCDKCRFPDTSTEEWSYLISILKNPAPHDFSVEFADGEYRQVCECGYALAPVSPTATDPLTFAASISGLGVVVSNLGLTYEYGDDATTITVGWNCITAGLLGQPGISKQVVATGGDANTFYVGVGFTVPAGVDGMFQAVRGGAYPISPTPVLTTVTPGNTEWEWFGAATWVDGTGYVSKPRALTYEIFFYDGDVLAAVQIIDFSTLDYENDLLTDTDWVDDFSHNWGEDWSNGGVTHWHECSLCGDKKDEIAHDFHAGPNTARTEFSAGVCSVCDYEVTPVDIVGAQVIQLFDHQYGIDYSAPLGDTPPPGVFMDFAFGTNLSTLDVTFGCLARDFFYNDAYGAGTQAGENYMVGLQFDPAAVPTGAVAIKQEVWLDGDVVRDGVEKVKVDFTVDPDLSNPDALQSWYVIAIWDDEKYIPLARDITAYIFYYDSSDELLEVHAINLLAKDFDTLSDRELHENEMAAAGLDKFDFELAFEDGEIWQVCPCCGGEVEDTRVSLSAAQIDQLFSDFPNSIRNGMLRDLKTIDNLTTFTLSYNCRAASFYGDTGVTKQTGGDDPDIFYLGLLFKAFEDAGYIRQGLVESNTPGLATPFPGLGADDVNDASGVYLEQWFGMAKWVAGTGYVPYFFTTEGDAYGIGRDLLLYIYYFDDDGYLISVQQLRVIIEDYEKFADVAFDEFHSDRGDPSESYLKLVYEWDGSYYYGRKSGTYSGQWVQYCDCCGENRAYAVVDGLYSPDQFFDGVSSLPILNPEDAPPAGVLMKYEYVPGGISKLVIDFNCLAMDFFYNDAYDAGTQAGSNYIVGLVLDSAPSGTALVTQYRVDMTGDMSFAKLAEIVSWGSLEAWFGIAEWDAANGYFTPFVGGRDVMVYYFFYDDEGKLLGVQAINLIVNDYLQMLADNELHDFSDEIYIWNDTHHWYQCAHGCVCGCDDEFCVHEWDWDYLAEFADAATNATGYGLHVWDGFDRDLDTHSFECDDCGYVRTGPHEWSNWFVINEDGDLFRFCYVCAQYGHLIAEFKEHCGHSSCDCPDCDCEDGGGECLCGAATCTDDQVCVKCGAVMAPAFGHDFSGDWVTDGDDHWKVCADCGVVDKAAHNLVLMRDGNGHWMECSVCGYIEAESSHIWSGRNMSDNIHSRYCVICGIIDYAEHTPGAAATCTASQDCTVCGYVIAPALGHVSSGPATCTDDEVCTVCDWVITPAWGHDYRGQPWVAGEDNHWKICETCQEPGMVAAHTPGAEATCETAQVCAVCGCVLERALGHDFMDPKKPADWSRNSLFHWVECSRCDAKDEYEPHDYQFVVAYTSVYYLCSVCGDVKEIPVIGGDSGNIDPDDVKETYKPFDSPTNGKNGAVEKSQSIVSGANGTWAPAAPGIAGSGYQIVFADVSSKVSGVLVNGAVLSAEDYTVSGDDSDVTLSDDYLASLGSGIHHVEIMFGNGAQLATTLKIERVDSAGNGLHPAALVAIIAGAVLLLLLLALGVLAIYRFAAGKKKVSR
ncbi:MAG: hypothetical protein FWD58_08010 [Firmicutes bacterium]|nr:hypothetical protein [Bacillota bacterium]